MPPSPSRRSDASDAGSDATPRTRRRRKWRWLACRSVDAEEPQRDSDTSTLTADSISLASTTESDARFLEWLGTDGTHASERTGSSTRSSPGSDWTGFQAARVL